MEIFDTVTLPQGPAAKKKAPAMMTVTHYGKIAFNKAAIEALGLKDCDGVSFGHDGRDLYIIPGNTAGYPLRETKTNLNFSHQVLVERILGFVKKNLLKDERLTYRFLIAGEPQELAAGGGVGWAVITSSCEAIIRKQNLK